MKSQTQCKPTAAKFSLLRQVWTALLVYLLLRFCAFLSQWSHSFTRLFTLIRSALWQRLDLRQLLDRYGTAGGGGRFLGTPQQAYLPGLT